MPDGPNVDETFEALHSDNINGTSVIGKVTIQVANQSPATPLDDTVFEFVFSILDDTNYETCSFKFKLSGDNTAKLSKALDDMLEP